MNGSSWPCVSSEYRDIGADDTRGRGGAAIAVVMKGSIGTLESSTRVRVSRNHLLNI
jgi:hypothetical protein